MRRKKKDALKRRPPVKCIVILSSSEDENWDKAKRKEDKQLRYINQYAKAHALVPMEIVRRGCFGAMEMNKIFQKAIAKLNAGKADAILVENALAISTGISDAYLKIGRVVENGHRFFSVDEGELKFDLYNPSADLEVRDEN